MDSSSCSAVEVICYYITLAFICVSRLFLISLPLSPQNLLLSELSFALHCSFIFRFSS